MNFKNSRRRFLAGLSCGTALATLSPSLFAETTELPLCSDGVITHHGRQFNWDLSGVVSEVGANTKTTFQAKDVYFYNMSLETHSRGTRMNDKEILTSYIRKHESSDEIEFLVNAPQFFNTRSARYDALKVDRSVLYDIYQSSLDGSNRVKANNFIKIKRAGKVLFELDTSRGESGGFVAILLEPHLVEKMLGDGKSALELHFYADNRLLLSREVNVNGMLQGYRMAMAKHREQVNRKEKGICKEADCFLTTATCQGIGLSDDCWELTMLRKFRDEFMLGSSNNIKQQQIKSYYEFAPQIVERLATFPQSKNIYRAMYWRYILPCAILIQFGFNEKAYQGYQKLVKWVGMKTV